MEQEPPTYLTAREAASYLRVSENWLYLQALKKEVRCIRIAGRRSIRFRRVDLDEWMERNLEGPKKEG